MGFPVRMTDSVCDITVPGRCGPETRELARSNYWTGDIVLAKELVPRVRLWDELLTVFRLRRATHPSVRVEFGVSDLELGSQPEPPLTELKYPLVSGREGPLKIKKAFRIAREPVRRPRRRER